MRFVIPLLRLWALSSLLAGLALSAASVPAWTFTKDEPYSPLLSRLAIAGLALAIGGARALILLRQPRHVSGAAPVPTAEPWRTILLVALVAIPAWALIQALPMFATVWRLVTLVDLPELGRELYRPGMEVFRTVLAVMVLALPVLEAVSLAALVFLAVPLARWTRSPEFPRVFSAVLCLHLGALLAGIAGADIAARAASWCQEEIHKASLRATPEEAEQMQRIARVIQSYAWETGVTARAIAIAVAGYVIAGAGLLLARRRTEVADRTPIGV